jgi:plasmid maintenance system antidote protein VapI
MRQNALNQPEMADEAHLGERTIRRLLKDKKATARTWAEVVKALDTTFERLLDLS